MHLPLSPKLRVQVALPWMPILLSMPPHVTSFGSPNEPSGLILYLGNDENRDAFGSARIAFDARQNRVDDVFGQIMIAGRDEALGAGDRERAVRVSLGLALERADIRTGARLGQTHGAAPHARKHFLKNGLAQRVLEEVLNQPCGAMGETRVHDEGLV